MRSYFLAEVSPSIWAVGSTRLDRGLELDAGSSQNVSLLIESSSEWLFVTRIFRDAQERDPGLGRAGQ